MKIALVKFGDVVAECATAAGDAAGFEGGNRYVRDFLDATSGEDVLLLSLGVRDAESVEGHVSARVLGLEAGSGLAGRIRLARGTRWIRRQLLKYRPDVIVCLDTGPPAQVCATVAEKTDARLVLVATTDLAGNGPGRLLRARNAARALGSRQTVAALACSSAIARQVRRAASEALPVEVYHPDYRSLIGSLPEMRSAAQRLRRAVFVGRLSSVKGADRLPGIAEVVCRDQQAAVLVVGDGPQRERIANEIAVRDYRACVDFAGTLEHARVIDQMAESRVVIVPSRSEGVAKVAIEALLAGTPVVAFDVGGIGDAVVDGVSGVLVPAGDVAQFARAVETLLSDDSAWESLVEGVAETRDELVRRRPTFGEALRQVLEVHAS